ncbi:MULTISPECIES: VOC family protein [unclassified Serratia (in: enterobacteria)]|uniref:VOC family protein n=1 Tax=unclassified Serratia (in: enterobacteria) TaxID=2647522 RepID=UPI00046A19D9|nr:MULTISPECIES: VOC family protein [unclassified Serratia (in: enterobacteria)]
MTNPISGLAHIGLRSADIERATRFYHSLGFTTSQSLTLEDPQGSIEVSFLTLCELTLELYQLPWQGQTRDAASLGIDHVALRVDDLAAAQRWVTELGYPLTEGPTLQPSGRNGVRYFMIAGPDGERVEFNQPL